MVDERSELATLQLGLTSCANATSDDGEIKGGHHRHRAVVVGFEELLRQDRSMGRQVEPRGEIGEPAYVGRVWRPSVGAPVHLRDLFDGKRPVVLILAYARCTMLCSVVLRGMAEAVQPPADPKGSPPPRP